MARLDDAARKRARASARVQLAGDRDVRRQLREGVRALDHQIAVLRGRGRNLSEGMRRDQIEIVARMLVREQSKIMKVASETAQARRLEAAAAARRLGGKAGAGLPQGAATELDRAMARMYGPQLPIPTKAANIDAWLRGRVQRLVDDAVRKGTSPQDFAVAARDFINPRTPGGIRFAAQRLVRTETGNAFHAATVQNAIDDPEITVMQWHLSATHGHADECDDLAKDDSGGLGPGRYRPEDVPELPHPHCMCVVVPVSV